MPRKKVTVYTVREVYWDYNDEFYYREEVPLNYEDGDPYGGITNHHPLKAFISREKAEAYRLELERKRRKDENPFCYGDYGEGLAAQSTASPAAFQERLEELGLEPVDFDEDSNEWWEANVGQMTPEQRDGVWGLLDRVCFYEVVPMQVALEE